ncbi:hypothetical protein ASE95_02940 [Sphingomonas sp. Leaf231]|nr:hypothetical protein ASE95_02940 [Sphingomonas sp. Leaf231]
MTSACDHIINQHNRALRKVAPYFHVFNENIGVTRPSISGLWPFFYPVKRIHCLEFRRMNDNRFG